MIFCPLNKMPLSSVSNLKDYKIYGMNYGVDKRMGGLLGDDR